jgi:hypothetical protein
VEIDRLVWQPGWTPVEIYNAEHARLIGEESWIIDGLGRLESIPSVAGGGSHHTRRHSRRAPPP